jgi:hypothetical protein
VKRDFSDLPAAMEHLEAHQEKAEWIANNSAAILRDRFLMPAPQACY